jgi:hypothetical protein
VKYNSSLINDLSIHTVSLASAFSFVFPLRAFQRSASIVSDTDCKNEADWIA